MMPHYHSIIAAISIIAVMLLFFPEITATKTILWILTASIIAALIDMDAVLLVNIKSKANPSLQKYKNIKNISADFNSFIDALGKTGVLKTVIATHLTTSALLTIAFYLFLPPYFIPAVVGIITHLLADISYVRKL